MEYAEGQPYCHKSKTSDEHESNRMLDQIARAIKIFLSFPISGLTPIRPVGGGPIVHPLFFYGSKEMLDF